MRPMHVEQKRALLNKYHSNGHSPPLCVELQDPPSKVCVNARLGPPRAGALPWTFLPSYPARQLGLLRPPRCAPFLHARTPLRRSKPLFPRTDSVCPPPSSESPEVPPPLFWSMGEVVGSSRAALQLHQDSNQFRISPEPKFYNQLPRRSPPRMQKGQLSPCFLRKSDFRTRPAHPPLCRPPMAPMVHLASPATDSNPFRLSPEPQFRHQPPRRSPPKTQKGQLSPCVL